MSAFSGTIGILGQKLEGMGHRKRMSSAGVDENDCHLLYKHDHHVYLRLPGTFGDAGNKPIPEGILGV